MKKSKIDLTGLISHNVKGPLKYLHHLTQFTLKNWDAYSKQEIKDSLRTIDEAVHQMWLLLENSTRWQQLENNKLEIKIKGLNVSDLLEKDLLLYQSLIQQKNITVKKSMSQASTVQADEMVLRLIIQNLLSNAFKYCPENKVVAVSEIAVPNAYLLQIENETNSTNNTDNTPEYSAGLGLQLAEKLCAEIGAHLEIDESTPNQFAARLHLPI